MKFYVIYQQSFPLGFGLAAMLCIAVGVWSLVNKTPLIFPFLISLLTWIGGLVPLFLLSLNHFLVAWPLDFGAALLNAFGVIACPAVVAYFWLSHFDLTTVGVPKTIVAECLGRVGTGSPEKKSRAPLCFSIFPGSICFLRMPADGSTAISEFKRSMQQLLDERLPQRNLEGAIICIVCGVACAITASISWCTAARCWTEF